MMTIKIKLFFVLSIIIFGFTCCKKEKVNRFTIGVSQCSDDLWRQTMNQEMIRETEFFKDVNIIIKTVKDNTNTQIQQLDSLIDLPVDILIVSPNESKAFVPILKKARNRGIPVILIDRKIDTDDYTAYIGADNFQVGKEVGLYTAAVLRGKGNVVEIRGWNGSTSDQERHDGFLEGIKNYPEITIIAEANGNYLKDAAKKSMTHILEETNNIDLVFAFNDPMATGVAEAYKDKHLKKPFVIGIDALTVKGGGVENIQNGIQNASFIYPTGGEKAIDLAMTILTNKPFDRDNILHTMVVDKNNFRVLQLQTEQIAEQQEKVNIINSNLNLSLEKYTNQRILFYLSIVIIGLISFILAFLLKAYKSKSKSNRLLEKQNDEIKEQAQELKNQKEQLLSMSQELRDATHSKLVFFTNISHEFKTPLSLILGPIESLLADNKLDLEQRELLNLVQKNSNRLLLLISEIIEFRSYENGKMKMFFAKSNLKDFIEEINSLFYSLIKKKKISFTFNTTNDSFDIIFDKEKVEKIYYNLLSNALKYVNFMGSIKIELGRGQINNIDSVMISVFNSGSYIEPDNQEKVFDRFYKIDTNAEGSGIGLALTSTLVEAHKGKIEIHSEKNIGTTFIVYLPVLQDELLEKYDHNLDYIKSKLLLNDNNYNDQDISKYEVNNDDEKPLILLVEDNFDMRKFLCHILVKEYNIIEASNGLDGITRANKYIPDIVVSDVMMDVKDGFELCQTLKGNTLTSHIPIILLTAYSLDEQKTIGFESGADAYIPKPFNADILKIRIRKLIENRRKLKETFSKDLIVDNKKESIGIMEDAFISDFKIYVEQHISDSELSVEDIAKYLGLSRSQLYRKIKSLTDYSPNDLIRIIRLNYAKILLATKTKSISEVAYDTGFSSPPYFTKCFKSIYGINPTEYLDSL